MVGGRRARLQLTYPHARAETLRSEDEELEGREGKLRGARLVRKCGAYLPYKEGPLSS